MQLQKEVNSPELLLGHDKLMLCFLDAAGQQFANSKKKIKIT